MKNFIYNPRNLKILSLLFVVVFSFVFASVGQAGLDLNGPLEKAGKGIYGSETLPTADSMPTIIGKVIGVVLSLVGIILVIIIVYAGFTWMTGGGDPEKIKDAKSWMLNAVIGLLICLVAYSLSSFVVTKIFDATKAVPPT